MFVLALCVFEKTAYATTAVRALTKFKFDFFGHDAVVMHEREIRKQRPPFEMLRNPTVRASFMQRLNELVEDAPFTLIAAAIDKGRLSKTYAHPENPYHLAVTFGLERLALHLDDLGDQGEVHVVFESRGKNEDAELELAFRRACDTSTLLGSRGYTPLFAPKKANHAGLQLADLIARPIGLHCMRPSQPNRAFDLIQSKFWRGPTGSLEGWGLKRFP